MSLVFKTSEECILEFAAPPGGDDWMPVTAARVSFNRDDTTGNDVARDRKLMKYLADHGHTSCFEHQTATFVIECPLFVRSQIMRHRTFSYNEVSRRYTSEDLAMWAPIVLRPQHQTSRQCSADTTLDPSAHEFAYAHYDSQIRNAVVTYDKMLELGVAREQARAVLPQAMLTRFYMSGNLRNWVHFLKLRKDGHAQEEVQIVARRIEAKLREVWPESMNALMGEVEVASPQGELFPV